MNFWRCKFLPLRVLEFFVIYKHYFERNLKTKKHQILANWQTTTQSFIAISQDFCTYFRLKLMSLLWFYCHSGVGYILRSFQDLCHFCNHIFFVIFIVLNERLVFQKIIEIWAKKRSVKLDDSTFKKRFLNF
jgi:hypothetical protein